MLPTSCADCAVYAQLSVTGESSSFRVAQRSPILPRYALQPFRFYLNPFQHMETIFGIENVHVVNVDGSPSGRKEHIVWNPPFIDKTNVTQGRVHTITEASRVFRFLMDKGIRAIVFCKAGIRFLTWTVSFIFIR